MEAAAASGDLSTIISLMSQTAEQTPADFIRKTCGDLMFIYYTYVNHFHTRPTDLIDLVDGLLFMDAYGFLEKRAYEQARKRAEKKNGL